MFGWYSECIFKYFAQDSFKYLVKTAPSGTVQNGTNGANNLLDLFML